MRWSSFVYRVVIPLFEIVLTVLTLGWDHFFIILINGFNFVISLTITFITVTLIIADCVFSNVHLELQVESKLQ